MKGKLAIKPLSALRRQPIRTDHGTEEELKALAESWLTRPIHPIIVRPDLTIADGHRRIEGLTLLGKVEAEVFITDENLTDDQIIEISLLSAVHRKGLSDFERVQAMKRLAAVHADWPKSQLAKHLQLDASMVTRMLPSGALTAEVEAAFKEGKIGISTRYDISQLPPDEQHVLLNLKLGGASRDEVAKAARASKKKSEGETDAETKKTESVKIMLDGVTISLKGTGLTLSSIAKLLLDAGKEANAGVRDGQAAKTFERLMRDRDKKAMEAKKAEALKQANGEVATA